MGSYALAPAVLGCVASASLFGLFSPTHIIKNERNRAPSDRPVRQPDWNKVDDILEAVLRGLAAGQKLCPSTTVTVLLCCFRGQSLRMSCLHGRCVNLPSP